MNLQYQMLGQQTAVCVHSILAGMHTPGLHSRRDERREMAARKGLSKRIRFEVFKRDAFKCQYCGKAAPDVILHVDHIDPVSRGGNNDVLNLITSCLDCNAGKGARELSDDSAVTKQREQLEALNERREQLEMMLKWRDGLKEIDDTKLAAIASAWESHVAGWHLNERGMQTAKGLLRKFPLSDILDAIEVSASKHLQVDGEGKLTRESVELAWSRISGMARFAGLPEEERQLRYIRGIVRNRMGWIHESECIGLLREAASIGIGQPYLRELALQAMGWGQWCNWMESAIKKVRNWER